MIKNDLFFAALTNFLVAFALVFFFSVSGYAVPSGASLSPTRIVIPDDQNSASVTIRNTSDAEISYRLSLVEMGLDDNGYFGRLTQSQLHPNHKSAKPIIRFSPRQVRLKPGASQVVRVIARRRGLSKGEYRSHMLVSALPAADNTELADNQNKEIVIVQSSSSSNVGVTIPVIVREGATNASVIPENTILRFNDSGVGGKIEMQLGLKGNRSAYGDFEVTHISGGEEQVIAVLKSFALYYPYPRETVTISLRPDVDRASFNGNSRIRIRFKNKSVDSNLQYWSDHTVVPVLQ